MYDEEQPASPLNKLVNEFIENHDGPGWLVSCAKKEEDSRFAIELVKKLPEIDERLGMSPLPHHSFDTPVSLANYAKRYATGNTLAFVHDDRVVVVMDETRDRGDKVLLSCQRVNSGFHDAWRTILGAAHDPKKLRTLLLPLRRTLMDVEIIGALNQIQYSETLDIDKKVDDDGVTIGVSFKGTTGFKMREFPKRFRIAVPILHEDVIDPGLWETVEISVEIKYPERQGEGLAFMLLGDTFEIQSLQRWRKAVEQAFTEELETAEKIQIFHGEPKYVKQLLAKNV